MTADVYIRKYENDVTLGELINIVGNGTGVFVEDSWGKVVLDFPGYGEANLSDYLPPEDVSVLDYAVQFFEASSGKIHVVLWEHYEQ